MRTTRTSRQLATEPLATSARTSSLGLAVVLGAIGKPPRKDNGERDSRFRPGSRTGSVRIRESIAMVTITRARGDKESVRTRDTKDEKNVQSNPRTILSEYRYRVQMSMCEDTHTCRVRAIASVYVYKCE